MDEIITACTEAVLTSPITAQEILATIVAASAVSKIGHQASTVLKTHLLKPR